MRFGVIARHRGIWPLAWLCATLEVTRGGFYAWLKRPRKLPRQVYSVKLDSPAGISLGM